MSRRNVRFVFTALVVAGGLTLAPPNADAAGRTAQESDTWSLALQWVAQVWEESVVQVWEMAGDPIGAQPSTPPEGATNDQGFGMDPNG